MKAKYCPCLSVKLFADIATQSIHLRLSRRRGKMNIRYRVELSEAERSELGSLLRGGQHAARKLKRAQILLAADAGVADETIAQSLGVAMHPTVKPVGLVADAIKDVSKRKGIVLDPFGGSGTTIIAAEKTGRRARAIELDPKYVDVAVRRWERYTGRAAVLGGTGQTLEDGEAARTAANDSAVAR